MKILVALSTVVALSGLVGCGGDATSADSPPSDFLTATPLAVVKGRLLKVNLAGKNPRAAAGTIILTGKNGAEVSNEVGPTGVFEFRVAPGEYQVKGTSPQPDGGSAQCAAQQPKTVVSADGETVVDVFCFVG